MSRNQAAHCLLSQPDRLRVRMVHVLSRLFVTVVCVMITFRTVGQIAEAQAAKGLADVISGKSSDYLLAVALVIANITLLAVAKAYQQVTREAQITAVEVAKSTQRMADSIDKLAAIVSVHDERAIQFIDRQNNNRHQP